MAIEFLRTRRATQKRHVVEASEITRVDALTGLQLYTKSRLPSASELFLSWCKSEGASQLGGAFVHKKAAACQLENCVAYDAKYFINSSGCKIDEREAAYAVVHRLNLENLENRRAFLHAVNGCAILTKTIDGVAE